VGILGQGLSDAFSGNLSGWEDYLGSAIGGAAFGETLLYAGPVAAGLVGGAVTNASKQGLKNLTGKQCGFNWTSFGVDTAVGGATGFIPGSWLPTRAGLNAGRGSMVAVSKQMATKLRNGTISNVSPTTAAKMFAGRSAETAVPYGVAGGVAGSLFGNSFVPGYSDLCACQ
jgi:type VI secretion system secreted protein VgrG